MIAIIGEVKGMNGLRTPIFEKGNVVTAEMLNSLNELAAGYARTGFYGYSNGILCGCKVLVNDGEILIGRGILVVNECLYYITEPMRKKIQSTNEWTIVQFVIDNCITYQNIERQELEVVITSENDIRKDGIEICRFRLQQGASLRVAGRHFQELETEFDTINEIYAQWSSYGESTISINILQLFADEMGRKENREVIDYLFCQQIYQGNGRSINRKAIEMYINQKLRIKSDTYTNKEIYKRLVEILRLHTGNVSRMQERPRRMGPIIVD